MGTEIERKFLVTGDAWRAEPGTGYSQGYLNRDPDRTVRVRIAGDSAFLTIKGRGKSSGMTRTEFEYAIPRDDARSLLAMCDRPPVEKIRRKIRHGNLVWEVDEFLGANAGLVIAEVELEREDQPVDLPSWVGREVTGDARYYNASLAENPFRNWKDSGS